MLRFQLEQTMSTPEQDIKADVPTQVIESFLEALLQEGVSQEMVQRLKKTLIVDAKFTDKALKAALFPEETNP
jgi:hypothetical protein